LATAERAALVKELVWAVVLQQDDWRKRTPIKQSQGL